MDEWSGSSIDGSLDDGLDHSRNSIFGTTYTTTVHDKRQEREYYRSESPKARRKDSSDLEDVSHSTKIPYRSPPQSENHDLSLMIPSCLKLNKILADAGYSPIELSSNDLDFNKRTISVFIIDTWAQSLISCVSELLSHQSATRTSIDVLSHDLGRSGASHHALEASITSLKESLEGSERRERLAAQKLESVEKECNDLMKQMADLNFESKKKIKNLEALIQESERKLRQKEIEYSKIKEKFQALNKKDLGESSFHNQVIVAHRRGDLDISVSSDHSSSSTSSMISSPNHLKTRTQSSTVVLTKESNRNSSSKKTKKITQDDAIHALQIEKNELLSHNEDLEKEINTLTSQLKKSYQSIQQLQLSKDITADAGAASDGDRAEGRQSSRHQHSVRRTLRGETQHFPKESSREEEGEGNDKGLGSDQFEREEDFDLFPPDQHHDSASISVSQSQRIRSLVQQLEEQKLLVKEVSEDNQHLKEKNFNLTRSLENLRLEIGSRPTAKEFKDKLKEITELESQLRDVLVMRKESQEIKSWSKHISTHERILMDKKNYELKLWLLEALPKTVMKEILQGVCRELELNEVSDVVESIKKLKLVIKTVPRMERFISTVCNFVFERAVPTHLEGDPISRPVMEDVLPILKRWWRSSQDMIHLRNFQEDVIFLVQKSDFQTTTSASTTSASVSASAAGGAPLSFHEILFKIKSLIEFQKEIFRQSENWESAERYLVERPEVLVNSLLEHIRYLFGVSRLEGLIPKLNEVYLFTEEMSNFLMNLRKVFGMKPGIPDATVITEVYRIVQERRQQQGEEGGEQGREEMERAATSRV
jgi:myosin heavy subunit